MRIVVKLGTSLLTNDDGQLDLLKLAKHVENIVKATSHEIIIVTSGSIASGFKKLGFKSRPTDLIAKQAAAAAGQSLLIHAYQTEFAKYDVEIAQGLISRSDFYRRENSRNAKAALELLLEKKVVPVINENDLVAIEEINFGDNDTLAALISALMAADLLLVFTDQVGVFDKNPTNYPDAQLIDKLSVIEPELLSACSGESKFGTGGMRSKLQAAKVALSLGVSVFIGSGRQQDGVSISDVINKTAIGTYIDSDTPKIGVKKQWIAFHGEVKGRLEIDRGAKEALLSKGASLLPVGVINSSGAYVKGDLLEIFYENKLLGRGISRYDSSELESILKQESRKSDLKEVLHRDNWVAVITPD